MEGLRQIVIWGIGGGDIWWRYIEERGRRCLRDGWMEGERGMACAEEVMGRVGIDAEEVMRQCNISFIGPRAQTSANTYL